MKERFESRANLFKGIVLAKHSVLSVSYKCRVNELYGLDD
jgi:hypothetical protein